MKDSTFSKIPGPIAVFDSGYGGLTILEKLVKELPHNDFIYLGDNARSPYGTRSFDVVYQYTLESVVQLFKMGAHLVVLACNTASAKALRTIQQNNLPYLDSSRRVLGVIRPTVERVASVTKNGHVGVFGTPGTIQSNSYPLEILKIHPMAHVIQEACPMWVSLVENGEAFGAGADYFIKKHVASLLCKDECIDTIILGCTHYPILLPKIRQYLPSHISVLEQGDIVAASLKDYLGRHPEMDLKCSKGGRVEFFTTENPDRFEQTASLFFKGSLNVRHLSY